MTILRVFLAIAAVATLTCGFPSNDVEKNPRYYIKPLSSISPGDIRRGGTVVGNSITGFYTRVPPKAKWPNRVVPWEYDAASTFTDEEKAIIEKGISEITDNVCVEFVAKSSETAYISIKNTEDGCWAELGFQNKKQEVNMAKGCFEDTTTAIHEIMHAMGFEHEQTRYDRDMYVEIQWKNIKAGEEHNFEKLPRTYAYPSFDFDFLSLMMYTLDSFGSTGRPSMIVIQNPEKVDEYDIGRGKNMTDTDIWRIYSAYQCNLAELEPEPEARFDWTKAKLFSNIF